MLSDMEPSTSILGEDADLFERKAGLAEVARRNEKSLQTAVKPRYLYARWWGLVELGPPLPHASVETKIDGCGIGREERTTCWPVRLVLPTVEELQRYPIPTEAEPSAVE
jgi:hypothetical protein